MIFLSQRLHAPIVFGPRLGSFWNHPRAIGAGGQVIGQRPAQRPIGQIVVQIVKLVLVGLCLGGLLSACGATITAPPDLVKEAIALELDQTQARLAQKLHLAPPTFKLTQVHITQQTPLSIDGLPSVRVQGDYDIDLKFVHHRDRQTNPFDIFLQRQPEGKTWRLAIPQATAPANTPDTVFGNVFGEASGTSLSAEAPDPLQSWKTYRLGNNNG